MAHIFDGSYRFPLFLWASGKTFLADGGVAGHACHSCFQPCMQAQNRLKPQETSPMIACMLSVVDGLVGVIKKHIGFLYRDV